MFACSFVPFVQDTRLHLPAVDETDAAALSHVLRHRPDAVSISFVQTEADVASVGERLDAAGAHDTAVILKIETSHAFRNLAAMLFTASAYTHSVFARFNSRVRSHRVSAPRHAVWSDAGPRRPRS